MKWGGVALVVALTTCGCTLETVHVSYANRNDARSEIERGWIPEFIPPSAVEIRVVYNPEMSSTLLMYRFERVDHERMVEECQSTPEIPHELPHAFILRGVTWWPDYLRPGSSRPLPPGQYYRCPYTRVYADGHSDTHSSGLAIPGGLDVAYFWR